MSTIFGLYPFLLKLYADSGYQGPKFQEGVKQVCGQINVEIVKRSDAGKDRVPCRGVATALLSRAGCSVRLPGTAG